MQARESLVDMLECARNGAQNIDLKLAFDIFEHWDHRFTIESSAASIFEMWEF